MSGTPVAGQVVPPAAARRRAAPRDHRTELADAAHPAFVWPIDLVHGDGIPGFGYVMPLLEPRFRPFARICSAARSSRRSGSATGIGRRLGERIRGAARVRAVLPGHQFRQSASRSAATGEVAIMDNDNVGTDSSAIFVRGTLRFMAPEVVR